MFWKGRFSPRQFSVSCRLLKKLYFFVVQEWSQGGFCTDSGPGRHSRRSGCHFWDLLFRTFADAKTAEILQGKLGLLDRCGENYFGITTHEWSRCGLLVCLGPGRQKKRYGARGPFFFSQPRLASDGQSRHGHHKRPGHSGEKIAKAMFLNPNLTARSPGG